MPLRLATFNLENLGLRPGEDSPEARARLPGRLDALRALLGRVDADAVAFQELLDPALLPALTAGLGYDHVALAPPGSSPLRIGVASRHPLGEPRAVAMVSDLALADPRSGFAVRVTGAFSRPALRVTWAAPGLPMTLVVLHAKSKIPTPTPNRSPEGPWPSLADAGEGRLLSEVKRLAQAVELRRALDQLFASEPEARVALVGDFNDALDAATLWIAGGDARAAASPDLAPGELTPCEVALPPERRYTQRYRGRPELLDHLLVSRALAPHVAGVEVFHEGLRDADRPPRPDEFGSDHAPLVVTFRVPETAAR